MTARPDLSWLAGAATFLVLVGCEPASEPPPDAPPAVEEPRAEPERACSAAGLRPDLPRQDLPPPVAVMRERIAAAAVACDYEELERIALEGPGGFSFSFGAPEGGPAAHWRREETSGDGNPLARLVGLLGAPHATLPPLDGEELFVWPAIFGREMPSEEDWTSLEGVYSADEIARMKEDARRFGIGYLGYRAGVTASGDWIYFIAGD